MLEDDQINQLLHDQTSLDICPKKKSLYIYSIQMPYKEKINKYFKGIGS
jgi:hypothetical protein